MLTLHRWRRLPLPGVRDSATAAAVSSSSDVTSLVTSTSYWRHQHSDVSDFSCKSLGYKKEEKQWRFNVKNVQGQPLRKIKFSLRHLWPIGCDSCCWSTSCATDQLLSELWGARHHEASVASSDSTQLSKTSEHSVWIRILECGNR